MQEKQLSTEELIAQDVGARLPLGLMGWLITGLALAWSLFQLWIASPLPFIFGVGVLNDTETRAIHLTFALLLAYLVFPAFRRSPRDRVPLGDIAFGLIAASAAAYLFVMYEALARNLLLVEQSGVRAHFSQLTSARGAEMIAQAQARGLPVTADVAMYQLILTDEALHGFSSLYHVQPPLRTAFDRDGLREAVKSGVIGAIASHHQPHEPDAKLAPFGATEPGISSVELLLPLALTLVQDGLLDLPTLLARLTSGPAKALRLPAGRLAVGAPADILLFEAEGQTLAGEKWYSKGGNSPFIGHCLPGKVRHTLVDGRISFQG